MQTKGCALIWAQTKTLRLHTIINPPITLGGHMSTLERVSGHSTEGKTNRLAQLAITATKLISATTQGIAIDVFNAVVIPFELIQCIAEIFCKRIRILQFFIHVDSKENELISQPIVKLNINIVENDHCALETQRKIEMQAEKIQEQSALIFRYEKSCPEIKTLEEKIDALRGLHEDQSKKYYCLGLRFDDQKLKFLDLQNRNKKIEETNRELYNFKTVTNPQLKIYEEELNVKKAELNSQKKEHEELKFNYKKVQFQLEEATAAYLEYEEKYNKEISQHKDTMQESVMADILIKKLQDELETLKKDLNRMKNINLKFGGDTFKDTILSFHPRKPTSPTS